jgi:hypothetical protein
LLLKPTMLVDHQRRDTWTASASSTRLTPAGPNHWIENKFELSSFPPSLLPLTSPTLGASCLRSEAHPVIVLEPSAYMHERCGGAQGSSQTILSTGSRPVAVARHRHGERTHYIIAPLRMYMREQLSPEFMKLTRRSFVRHESRASTSAPL